MTTIKTKYKTLRFKIIKEKHKFFKIILSLTLVVASCFVITAVISS